MKIPNSLLIATLFAFGVAMTLKLSISNDQAQLATASSVNTEAAYDTELSQLKASNKELSQRLIDLETSFNNLQASVEISEQGQLEQTIANVIEQAANNHSGMGTINETFSASIEQNTHSPEQKLLYDDIHAWLIDPGNYGTITFTELESRALELPVRLQQNIMEELRSRANNGEIDLQSFFMSSN